MRKIAFIFIFTLKLSAQEIVTLKYDNTGLDYREPEIRTSYSPDEYRFQNVSIPTLELILPDSRSKPTTAIIVCPGGGMAANSFFHEGLYVAKALNEREIGRASCRERV